MGVPNCGLLELSTAKPLQKFVGPAVPGIRMSGHAPHSIEERAASHAMRVVDLANASISGELLAQFPAGLLFREKAVPVSENHLRVCVAIGDPTNMDCVNELAVACGKPVEPLLAEPRQIEAKLHELLGVAGGTISDMVDSHANKDLSPNRASEAEAESDASSDPSVVRLVNELLQEALAQSASDVHIEPRVAGIDVRFRVDGQLRVQPIPDELHRFRAAITSRLKIMAKLNIAEKQRPQDGRIKIKVEGNTVDVRVSVIPMLHGEGVVLRLLDSSRAPANLDQLSFPAGLLSRWRQIIQRPHGMILVTGPTGSGKTTTLYGSMAEVRGPTNKVITLEDPVEYQMEGISQIPVHPKVGLTFAAGLTSILRHDPDVILIGEIRDTETAVSAVQASLTGHLVFSTLHTNDATSALTRLTDMGIAPYLAASTVQAVLAQRLVRRLCPNCKQPASGTDSQRLSYANQVDEGRIFEPRGCKACFQTGFRGRRAIYELLEVDASVRELFVKNASAHQIRNAARTSGMQSLRESGLELVQQGETTMDEVLRIAVEDEALDAMNGSSFAQQASMVTSR